MAIVVFIIVTFVEVAAFGAALFFIMKSGAAAGSSVIEDVQTHLQQRKDLLAQVEALSGEFVEFDQLKEQVKALRLAKEALKTERGRITITQAERETVEGRLRELEEIERELEASGIETKEELSILQKKEKDLRSKNDALKGQISNSVAQIEEIIAKVELTAQMQEQVQAMKTQMVQTEQQVDTLLLQIELGNEQYFILKKRYDALDIEYAQLFEKFSESSG